LASADADSDLWRLGSSTGCGLCVEPHQPEKLAAALLRLYGDSALRARMATRGRDEAVRAYSREAIVAQYESLCHALVARHRSRVRRLPAQLSFPTLRQPRPTPARVLFETSPA